jgi:hypothetical protein
VVKCLFRLSVDAEVLTYESETLFHKYHMQRVFHICKLSVYWRIIIVVFKFLQDRNTINLHVFCVNFNILDGVMLN